MCNMAERFAFLDPFDKRAINRVTRYRAKKLRHADDVAGKTSPAPLESMLDVDVGAVSVSPDHISSGSSDEEYPALLEHGSTRVEDDSGRLDDDSSIIDDCVEPSPISSHELVSKNSETTAGNVSLDKPLYDGSPITVTASNVLIMKLKMKHSLSNECVRDLLSLIKLHCPSPNNCVASLYKFTKIFGKCNTVLHFHCNTCYESVTEDDMVCKNSLCKNNLVIGGRSSFIEVPIEQQLRKILERK